MDCCLNDWEKFEVTYILLKSSSLLLLFNTYIDVKPLSKSHRILYDNRENYLLLYFQEIKEIL